MILVKRDKKLKKEIDQFKQRNKRSPKHVMIIFQECIKNKRIPKDISKYLRKAFERAMKEYDVGIKQKIKHEKSAPLIVIIYKCKESYEKA